MVSREFLKWALITIGLPMVYVNLIEDTYEGASIKLGSLCGETEYCKRKSALGFGLSIYVFSLVMDEITLDI